MAADRLASSGDPPTRLGLTLIRFRLEAIDSGWKVVSIRRVLPGDPARSRFRPGRRQCRDPGLQLLRQVSRRARCTTTVT